MAHALQGGSCVLHHVINQVGARLHGLTAGADAGEEEPLRLGDILRTGDLRGRAHTGMLRNHCGQAGLFKQAGSSTPSVGWGGGGGGTAIFTAKIQDVPGALGGV